MIYQSLEELKAVLLINPSLNFDINILGENLYVTYLDDEDLDLDYVLFAKRKIIELKSKEDILSFLNHSKYYFDYIPHLKEFGAID